MEYAQAFNDIDIDIIVKEILNAANNSISEEDFKIRAEYIFRKYIFDKLGIMWASYEYTLLSKNRVDALYGKIIIEYEKPGVLKTKNGFDHAIGQIKNYIVEISRNEQDKGKYLGVAFDGYMISFIKYDISSQNWDITKAFKTNRNNMLKLLEAFRGLNRKPLFDKLIIQDFGPSSELAIEMIQKLYNKILYSENNRTLMFYDEWKRVFSQVCSYSIDNIKGLKDSYNINYEEIDYEKLFFTIHTYFALIMKFLAAEIAVMYGGYFLKSYANRLENAYMNSLINFKRELNELENGGVFLNLGISNFLEADYFSWYLDEWDDDIAESIFHIIKKISEYEPGTADLEPNYVKDLFKILYQKLVPGQIRHDLGEYYTPDWLAEKVMDEAGYTLKKFDHISKRKGISAPLNLRFLDPACGSGTFLILAIKRIKEYAKKNNMEREAIEKITKNIVGFDLNPLAVMASRINYLIQLRDLMRNAFIPIEIPVYFADSLLSEKRTTLTGSEYILRTSVGIFAIPISIVNENKLESVLDIVKKSVSNRYTQYEFIKTLTSNIGNINETEKFLISQLYNTFLKLEKEGKNGIWTRIIKNSFAPLFVGEFDFVIGNPPWISWDSLPKSYRDSTKDMWFSYGLFTLSGMKARLGGGKKDISMLFTYICIDRYLRNDGILGFLLTQAVIKTKGAGEGFRRFRVKDSPIKVLKVHDFSDFNPFEGASNKTIFMIFKKNRPTKYPISYIKWYKKGKIDYFSNYDEIKNNLIKEKLKATPISNINKNSPWITLSKDKLWIKNILKSSDYEAHLGINSGGANSVYLLNIIEKLNQDVRTIEVPIKLKSIFSNIYGNVENNKINLDIRYLLIENKIDESKKKLDIIQRRIEDTFIFPVIKSRHLKPWGIKGYNYHIVVQNPDKRIGYDERWMKINFRYTYDYLKNFEYFLKERAAYKKYFDDSDPFYTMFNIGIYTFNKYKVVWNRMGNKLKSSVISTISDYYLSEKMLLPDNVISFIGCSSENEAHYICSRLNSNIANDILQSIAKGTKSFGTPSFIEDYMGIEKYNNDNELHKELAILSKKAHINFNEEKDNVKIEIKINKIVNELYGIE